MRSFEQLSAYTATKIRYTAAPIADILSEATNQPSFAVLRSFLSRFGTGQEWHELFRQGVEQDLSGQGLETADTAAILAWGEGLGSSDLTGQTDHCRQYGEQLKALADSARQEALTKGRLYTSLGVAGGLTAALLWL